jgi:hypothetical protein
MTTGHIGNRELLKLSTLIYKLKARRTISGPYATGFQIFIEGEAASAMIPAHG